MSNSAVDHQKLNDPTAMDGLEELFEVRELGAIEGANRGVQDANTMSVEEAADKLKISVRAVQKRLKKGTLAGRKQKTSHGERWLVEVREQDVRLDANRDDLVTTNKNLGANCNVVDASRDELEYGANKRELVNTNEHLALIRELQHKNEALIFRTGYLEAELCQYKEQVKLLTDSQHKTGWWAKFASWFFKSQ